MFTLSAPSSPSTVCSLRETQLLVDRMRRRNVRDAKLADAHQKLAELYAKQTPVSIEFLSRAATNLQRAVIELNRCAKPDEARIKQLKLEAEHIIARVTARWNTTMSRIDFDK